MPNLNNIVPIKKNVKEMFLKANIHYKKGDHQAVIKALKQVKKYLTSNHFKSQKAQKDFEVNVETCLGLSYWFNKQYDLAVISLNKVQEQYSNVFYSKKIELDPIRASIARLIGVFSIQIGQYNNALKSFKQAENIYSGEYCKNKTELNENRALIASNLGATYIILDLYTDALCYFRQAEKLYDSIKDDNMDLLVLKDECMLYENTSTLLSHMDDPYLWIKSKSKKLKDVIGLISENQKNPDMVEISESIKTSFVKLHRNWYRFILDKKMYSEINLILKAIEGKVFAGGLQHQIETETRFISNDLKQPNINL